ncbi:MAG: glycosyltransferase family 39 protein [bacterium]
MERFLNFIKSQTFLILVLAIINLLVALFLVKTPLQLNGDLPSYLKAMDFLHGDLSIKDVEINRVLTSPLMLYGSIAFGFLFGSEQAGMLAVNILFYFLIVYVFYRIVELIYQNKKVALIASILFFANYCMFNYGVTYRTDMGGWFFFLLTTLFAIKYYQSQLRNSRFLIYSVLAAAIGVLFKEYGALGMISLGFLILFSKVAFKQKVKKILISGALFIVIPFFYHLFIYLKFNYSYFDWYFYAFNIYIDSPETLESNYSIILLIKVFGWVFLVGWPIFLYGLYQQWKNYDKQRIILLLSLLPASLAFLAWPALTQRIAFIFVPWLALVAGFGLGQIKNKYLIIIILLVYVLVNYLTRPWLLSAINL